MSPPRIVAANVATLDGRIAASRSVPAWKDPSWDAIRALGYQAIDFLALHRTGVRLEGSNSFVARDAPPASLPKPATNVRSVPSEYLPDDVIEGYDKWMVVPDSRGRVAWDRREGGGAHLFVLVGEETPPAYRAFLRDQHIPYMVCGREQVDMEAGLQRVASTLGAETIVSTAGGVLNGVLLRLGLLAEVDLQILPAVLGSAAAPAIFEGYGYPERPAAMTVLHHEQRKDGSIFLRLQPTTTG